MTIFKDNINEWVTFACDGTSSAAESKRTKHIQGWSVKIGCVVYSLLFLYLFSLSVIIVNALFRSFAALQLGARFTISYLCL